VYRKIHRLIVLIYYKQLRRCVTKNHNWPWEDPHEDLEEMEFAELRMLRWLIKVQVAQGDLLVEIIEAQEEIMADLTALIAGLDEVKASAETASAAVLAALATAAASIADLQTQIDALVAAQVTQEQIDALTATAADIDVTVDAITAAVSPVVEPPPVDVP